MLAFLCINLDYKPQSINRKILDVPKRGSASTMFVSNGIANFEALIRKSFFFHSTLDYKLHAIV